MSKIGDFFEKVKVDFETVGKDFASIYTKLFGAASLTQLETTVENIAQSTFGQALLQDGIALLGQVKSGTISQDSAIMSLAQEAVTKGKLAGVQIEQAAATLVASAVIAKAQNLVGTPPPAPPSVPIVPIPAEPTPAAT